MNAESEKKFMACMLLFYAIHFMTLKHCKHDRAQHHAAIHIFSAPRPNSVALETSSVLHVVESFLVKSARDHNKQFFTYRCASQVNYNAFLFPFLRSSFLICYSSKSVEYMNHVVHSNV